MRNLLFKNLMHSKKNRGFTPSFFIRLLAFFVSFTVFERVKHSRKKHNCVVFKQEMRTQAMRAIYHILDSSLKR